MIIAMEKYQKQVRITGAKREKLAADLRSAYAEGRTIRELASEIGRSYGFTHKILFDGSTEMRRRGVRAGMPKSRAAA